eukprot:278541_1
MAAEIKEVVEEDVRLKDKKDQKKKEKEYIQIDGRIKNVYGINVQSGEFTVRMHMYFTFQLNDKEIEKYKKDPTNFIPEQLDFDIMNLKNYEQFEIISIRGKKYNIREDKNFSCRCKYELILVLIEQFELYSFPFDCQDLPIYIKLNRDISKQE